MDLSKKFEGFSKDLDDLNPEFKKDIKELIFSYRSGVFSVTVAFSTYQTLEKVLGFSLPSEILSYNSNRYGIDLESINSDLVRVYIDSPLENEVILYGYYLKDQNITEKKIYKKHTNRSIAIDRYDANGNIIRRNEMETIRDRYSWKGPKSIINIALQNKMHPIFLAKESKDQCYVRITL